MDKTTRTKRFAQAALAATLVAGVPSLALADEGALELQAGAIASEPEATASSTGSQTVEPSFYEAVESWQSSSTGNDATLYTQSLGPDGSGTTTYAGENMFETAIIEAKAAYPNGSESAVIVGPGDAWVDALSAAGLAASKGPILFTWQDGLHESTETALKDLGVKHVVIIGGTAAVGEQVVADLKEADISVEARLGGKNCYDTQLEIFKYGVENNLWNKDLVCVATGTWFADALSISPVAYAKKAPIFLVSGDGELNEEQEAAWRSAALDGYGKNVALAGGPAVISEEETVTLAEQMSALAGGTGDAKWLWGANQYDTSCAIAKWAVSSQGFSWNNAAFATGTMPYDALAGAVLQGETKSVLLLADSADAPTISLMKENRGSITQARFFGGTAALPGVVHTAVISSLSNQVLTESAGVAYERLVALEVLGNAGNQGYSFSDIRESMDPGNWDYGDSGYYQFALLNGGYSGVVTAEQLDAYIASTTAGRSGVLAGHGQDFIDAAKAYNVNEVYLLAHAILESGWGTSALARGTTIDGITYYNFYGIGAYDSDALGGGSRTAGSYGWDSIPAAIKGAAQWISSNYTYNTYSQNTLHKMRWNYVQAGRENTVWKQYATDRDWATKIARIMAQCYAYNGLDMNSCGLLFLVPLYS